MLVIHRDELWFLVFLILQTWQICLHTVGHSQYTLHTQNVCMCCDSVTITWILQSHEICAILYVQMFHLGSRGIFIIWDWVRPCDVLCNCWSLRKKRFFSDTLFTRVFSMHTKFLTMLSAYIEETLEDLVSVIFVGLEMKFYKIIWNHGFGVTLQVVLHIFGV